MKIKTDKKHKKQPYQTPKLQVLSLATDEVLSIGCKIASSAGPTGINCLIPACFQSGS
ncbi:hypothetical protein MNBD_GAMMA26-1430 [hydrothermal vent metagenome]|uniref:Uncharacterized protein n=1 Tax=hydrothermal vent metagenome TaxID=652676 RepID=A0A3B1B541_9ZZZZ